MLAVAKCDEHTLCRGWLEVYLTRATEAEAQQEQLTETLLACLLQLTHYIGDTGHHPAKQQRAWHTQQVLVPLQRLFPPMRGLTVESISATMPAAGCQMQSHCAWRVAVGHQMLRQGHT